MTYEEFKELKYGDFITHQVYIGCYVVHDIYDDGLIDTQCVNAIGVSIGDGHYLHDMFDYKYCEKITDPRLLKAIKFAITDESVDNRDEFIFGVKWALDNLIKDEN